MDGGDDLRKTKCRTRTRRERYKRINKLLSRLCEIGGDGSCSDDRCTVDRPGGITRVLSDRSRTLGQKKSCLCLASTRFSFKEQKERDASDSELV